MGTHTFFFIDILLSCSRVMGLELLKVRLFIKYAGIYSIKMLIHSFFMVFLPLQSSVNKILHGKPFLCI